MEDLILIYFFVAIFYGLYRLVKWVWMSLKARRERRRAAVQTADNQGRKKREELAKAEKLRRARSERGRQLQIALMQVPKSPDFRRAASIAAGCTKLPIAFRRRQFQRFRSLLRLHLGNRIAAGGDPEFLVESLGQLLKHLGIAAFEAEYLLQEVQNKQRSNIVRQEPSFARRAEKIQQEHQQRMQAIDRLEIEDDEFRERLKEEEDTRFRKELVQLQGGNTDPKMSV